jgi:hypothetical protein
MNLARYFEERDKNLPKPRWEYGDRVFAKFSSVPLIGMVIRERDGSVLIHADLPIPTKDGIRYVVNVPIRGIKRLKVFE